MVVTYSISANDLGTAATLATQRALADRFSRTDIIDVVQTGRSEFAITLNVDCDGCHRDAAMAVRAGHHHLEPPWNQGAGGLPTTQPDTTWEDVFWDRGAGWNGERVARHKLGVGSLSRSQFAAPWPQGGA
jgi:hypothetical protein